VEQFTGWRWNGAEWNRLELAKSGPSPADVSLEAASGGSSAVQGLWGPHCRIAADRILSPITSKPASQGRIKTGHSEVLCSYQVS